MFTIKKKKREMAAQSAKHLPSMEIMVKDHFKNGQWLAEAAAKQKL